MQNLDTLFTGISPNKFAENIFQDLFFQETTDFLQSAFQSQILLAHGISLGTALEKISQADQAHFTLLGKAITLLGGKPLLYNSHKQFFSGKHISQSTNVLNILIDDIALKEKSIIAYKTAISKLRSAPLKKILQQTLMQEENHLEILKNVVKNFKTQSK